jgi:3',5'-cyclic AMP phosphodiesterase CpdA
MRRLTTRWTRFFLAVVASGVVSSVVGARDAGAQGGLQLFRKGPFLQEVGPTSATVRFELASKGEASVDVAPAGDAHADAGVDAHAHAHITTSDHLDDTFHSVRIEQLAPATRYTYVVKAHGATSKGELVTAPTEGSGAPFTFLVYGDNRDDHESHAVVVRAMKQTPSDFLIHTGDFVATGASASDWQTFFDIEEPLLRDRCVFACVGNHELFQDSAAANYARYFGPSPSADAGAPKLYSTTRWSNARFFFLNAFDDWSGGEQRAWLEKALAASDKEAGLVWRFAIVHHGAWSAGPHGSSPRLASARIPELLASHGVDLMVSGHDHIYERGEADGIRYIVSGGGGAPLYRNLKALPSTHKVEAAYHFIEVAVADAAVKLVAKRADGSILERCGFSKAKGWSCDAPPAPAASSAPPTPALKPSEPESSPTSPSRCACDAVGRPAGTIGGGASALALFLFRSRRKKR